MRNFLRLVTGAGLVLWIAAAAWGQPTGTYNFDVASVKTAPSGNMIRMGMNGGPGSSSPGQITVENMSLRILILRAYGLKSYQLTAPEWMTGARYDIVAKVPANSTTDQVNVMWQNLLAERFKLTVHRESKVLPVYALVPAKGGPKLTEADSENSKGTSGSAGPASASGFGGGGGSVGGGFAPRAASAMPAGTGPGMSRYYNDGATMSILCDYLSQMAVRPVIDDTKLPGKYKIKLEFRFEEPYMSEPDGHPVPALANALQEQLGLRLEPRKSVVDLVVVDAAEKIPVEN